MQFRRLTRNAGLTSGWELEQRGRVGSHRSNSEHPRPPLHPASARSRSQRCRDAGGTVLSQEAQEGGSFSAEAPANLNPEYDEPRSSGALELWVGLAPFASGCVLHGGCGAGIRARPRGASSGDRADDRGVDRELGAVPQRQAVGDYLDATCITDRYIDVHVANPNISGHLCSHALTQASPPCWGWMAGRLRGSSPAVFQDAGFAVVELDFLFF